MRLITDISKSDPKIKNRVMVHHSFRFSKKMLRSKNTAWFLPISGSSRCGLRFVLSRNHFTKIFNTISKPTPLRVAWPHLRGLAGQERCLNTLILIRVQGGATLGLPPHSGEKGGHSRKSKNSRCQIGFTQQQLSKMHSGYHSVVCAGLFRQEMSLNHSHKKELTIWFWKKVLFLASDFLAISRSWMLFHDNKKNYRKSAVLASLHGIVDTLYCSVYESFGLCMGNFCKIPHFRRKKM
jgi:hypothetical protein